MVLVSLFINENIVNKGVAHKDILQVYLWVVFDYSFTDDWLTWTYTVKASLLFQ